MNNLSNEIENEKVWGIEKILTDCDYICSVLPKTPQTDNIMGNGKLQLCKGKY